MTLNDLQWGRILALAWLDSAFKSDFEIDPVKAFANLRGRGPELDQTYGASTLQILGINSPNISLSNFEGMSWPSVDFWARLPGGDLDAYIQGTVGNIVPGDSFWFWSGHSQQALKPAPPAPGAATLTPEAWVRIYARIWMDHRLNDPALEQQWKTKYGPGKQGYVDAFEKDPVATITRIVAEIKNKGWGTPIAYVPGTTRLWAVQDPNPTVGGLDPHNPPTMRSLVNPGTPPLVWDLNKCL